MLLTLIIQNKNNLRFSYLQKGKENVASNIHTYLFVRMLKSNQSDYSEEEGAIYMFMLRIVIYTI